MKCEFVDVEKAQWPVVRMCKMLKFSPKTYYTGRLRDTSQRELADEQLLVQIQVTFKASRGTYGSSRTHAALTAAGVSAGLNRVTRLMHKRVAPLAVHAVPFRYTDPGAGTWP